MYKNYLRSILTLTQPGKGRFTLTYMAIGYLHAVHTGLPSLIRVKISSQIFPLNSEQLSVKDLTTSFDFI